MTIDVIIPQGAAAEVLRWRRLGRQRMTLAVTIAYDLGDAYDLGNSGIARRIVPTTPSVEKYWHHVPYKRQADVLLTGLPTETEISRTLVGIAVARGPSILFAKRNLMRRHTFKTHEPPRSVENGVWIVGEDPDAYQAASVDQRMDYLMGGEQILLQTSRIRHHRLPACAPFATHLSPLGIPTRVPLVGDTFRLCRCRHGGVPAHVARRYSRERRG